MEVIVHAANVLAIRLRYVVCPKSKFTDFLFKCLLDSPEITSYPLQSTTLGKLHSVSSVFSTDHSSTGSNFPEVCVAHRLHFLYVFHRPKMMTLQLQFQIREEAEIARS
jgi:hypothetical protein